MAAEHGRDHEPGAPRTPGRDVTADERELEVELAQPVAQPEVQAGAGRRRAGRARCAASAAAPRPARPVGASTDHQRRCSATRRRSSAARSGACGSACSRTPWTSEPKVAPAGRSSIGEGTSLALGRGAIALRWSRRERQRPSSNLDSVSSSTVPGASGSLLTACWRPAPRRGSSPSTTYAASRCRRRGRSAGRRGRDLLGLEHRPRRRRARELGAGGAGLLPLRPARGHLEVGRHRASRSGTWASPALRPRSSRVSPAWPAFWLGPHHVTTCDWARVSAT